MCSIYFNDTFVLMIYTLLFKDDEDSERYLVDFNRKVLYETPVPDAKEKIEDSQDISSSKVLSSDSYPQESSK